ncbi:MAG TPA: carboxypeptidase regulatory-like domain-containing protein, partial [Elusimicrobiota bacterium]|nr:carboxypeptidase regulatory-like domain-containing protein [Elusimicrobiota bacterium]
QENQNGTPEFMLISAANPGLLPASLQIQALSAQGALGYASGPNGGVTPVLDADGEFTVDGLLPGTYNVLFTAPGSAGAVALVNTTVPGVVVQGGGVTDIGTADLVVGSQLSGRITDASSGLALANIPVQAVPSQRGSCIPSAGVQTLTDGNGRYVLNGLDPAVRDYDVYAAYRGNEQQGETLPPYQQTISPSVDVTTVSALNFALAPAAASVTGRVAAPAGGAPLGVPLLANGLALPGALVYLQRSGVVPLRNPIADIQFQTDIDGNFAIPSLTTGTYVLTATSLGYSPLSRLVTVGAGPTGVGVLTMSQGGTLSGTLTNADGSSPSRNSVSQILAATADQSSILAGALTTNPNTQTVSGYTISGFKPGLSYHVIIVDSDNGVDTPPEASDVVLTSTASATINITYRPMPPLAIANASRLGAGFQVSFALSQPLRNLTAADNEFSSILTTVSALGSLSQFALSQDRTILTAYYVPGVSESSFTLRCAGYTTVVDPESSDPVNNQFPIVSTVTFFLGIDALGQTNVANLNGGDVLVAGDNGRVTLQPGSFNVSVASSVLITLQVAEEPLTGTGVSAAGVGSAAAARLASLRYGTQSYPSEILAAAAAVPPTVNPLSAFYNIFLPLGVSTALSKPAQLTVSYSTGTDPTTLNLYWYNPAANAYVLTQDVTGAPPVIDTSNHTITLNVSHFSTYVLFNSAQAVITGGGGAGALQADNFPNPFDLGSKFVQPLHASSGGACSSGCTINGTMIGVSVPPDASGDAAIRIFNLAGTRVRSFDLGPVQGGTFYYQNWDGTNDSGRPVASGAYIGELKIGSRTAFFRMAVIKGSGL